MDLNNPSKLKKTRIGKVVGIIAIVVFVGFGAWGFVDDKVTEKNEQVIADNKEAILNFDSGNSEEAIAQLQEASRESVDAEVKVNTLKNLGYIYSSEGQYDQALQTLKEAFAYTSEGTFDYYLISGDIAVFEGEFDIAQKNYNKALSLRPDDFQINSALSLFYLDLGEDVPEHENYPEALVYAQKAYDVKTSDVKKVATENLAIAHYFNENYDQTISLFLAQGENPFVAYWLGWSYAMKEDEGNAKIYFRRAVDGGVDVEQEVYDYLASH